MFPTNTVWVQVVRNMPPDVQHTIHQWVTEKKVERNVPWVIQYLGRWYYSLCWLPTTGPNLLLHLPGVGQSCISYPDQWISRSPHLIHLTSIHPCNAEPPVELLTRSGLLTPQHLFYVRNHGSVPKWDGPLKIDGIVRQPWEGTVSQLSRLLPVRHVTATLACSGNRRKEINSIRMTTGFHWGPGAIGTAMWTGVSLLDVLQYLCHGLHTEELRERKIKLDDIHIWLEGADQHRHGCYGTSIPLLVLRELGHDAILAWAMNGELLEPDHGAPLRMVLPGHVGGRWVKWLKRIVFALEPSTNYYHYTDNRFSLVPVEDPVRELRSPDTLLMRQPVQSVITEPVHGTRISLYTKNLSIRRRPFISLSGYAYGGFGGPIKNVYVSVNGGTDWESCSLEEMSETQQQRWSWCFWSAKMELEQLHQDMRILVCATNKAGETQPAEAVWNWMGLMNHSWYELRLHEVSPHEYIVLHPCLAGDVPGGWRKEPEPKGFLSTYPVKAQNMKT